ncbi:hypothetical protein MN608_04747 [Microdochium nivale]|nr:hypothetical protein MN608_04747 [Microdochium nivale]
MQRLLQGSRTPKELRLARNGRPYHSWESASGFRSPANFVLFPTKYNFHTDPAYQWICPIRDCRNVFARWEKLDEHTENTHGGLQLNDNLDGTMSVVGTWNSDYLQVISQSRPPPGTPAPAQPCLPPVRELTPPQLPERNQAPAMHASAGCSMSEATRPFSACAAAVSRWEDRDITMPVSSPITAKLDAARDFHKSQREAMASLSSPAIGRSTHSELLGDAEDDVLIFDDDDNGNNGNRSIEQHPGMPSRQNTTIPIQSNVIYSPSSTVLSADSLKTPSTASTGLFMRPRRTSERNLLQKLSQSGSKIGLDPESPSARRSMRMQEKESSAAAPGAWNGRNSISSSAKKKKPAPLSFVSGVPLDARATAAATGSSWGGSPWTPSTPGNPYDSLVGMKLTCGAAGGDTPLFALGGKRRLSQLNATSDPEDGQGGISHASFANAAKRRGLLRLQYHSPTKSHDSDNDVTEQSSSADKDDFYLTPPSSQQTDLPLRPACKDAYLYNVGHAMEPWEISPGKLQAASSPVSSASAWDAGSPRLPDVAYSAPYLAQPNPVPLSPGVGAHLLYIGPGDQRHFGSDGSGGAVRERMCFVSSGKATVRISISDGDASTTGTASLPSSRRGPENKSKGLDTGESDQQRQKTDFEIGQGGVFVVARGTECLVANRQYEHLVLHVVALSC